jgi:hypothetical protein
MACATRASRARCWPLWVFGAATLGFSVETTFWLWRGDWLMTGCGFVAAVAAATLALSYWEVPALLEDGHHGNL